MRKIPSTTGPWILLVLAIFTPLLSFADKPLAKQDPKVVEVPLRGDWFKVRYDEIKDLTYVLSRDEGFGPGNPERTSAGDVVKLDVSAVLEGKVLYGNSKLSAYIDFSRMAGALMAKEGLFSSGSNLPPDKLENYRPYQNRLLLLEDCEETYFLLPSGERFKVSDSEDLSYKTKKSQGSLGEKYIWETLTVRFDWAQLNKLRDGAKIALGPVEFSLTKDSISQIRTVIMMIEDLAPQEPKDQ